MKFLDLFNRANIDIAKAAARETGEVLADGKVTPLELIDSGADLAHAALDAYGVAGRVIVDVEDGSVQEKVLACGEAVTSAIRAKLADGELTAAELVDLTREAAVAISQELVVAPDAPL